MYIIRLLALFLLLSVIQVAAQPADSVRTFKEVVITGFQPNSTENTSLNIEPYPLRKLNEKMPFNLSDALARLPGISQMTTGNAISKPVVRGLYGNRILILLSGLRFDNQQWQDEHGLGLSQIGIDRVEVIKGPASLLYGSDALGGVINVIEERPQQDGKHLDFGSSLFSNTLGTLSDMGFSRRSNQRWQRIRIGMESHSDYTDGNDTRVLNSRNGGYYLKAGFGFDKSRWSQENSYQFSWNQYGFILEDLPSFFDADSRWSRAMTGPHHIVMLNLLNSRNTISLKKSLLKFNAGLQSNSRREDEGGGQISLNMHLASALEHLSWEKNLSPALTAVISQQFSLSNNTNYGGRILIPDANTTGGILSGYLRFHKKRIIAETGAGSCYSLIRTFLTRSLNTPEEPVHPFNKQYLTANGMLGLVYSVQEWLTLKTNAGSGFRAPNLAELSSNGLHEGIYRYEIGSPTLKEEQNINLDLTLECNRKSWFFSASAFYNRFFHYIYLTPTTEAFYGFPVFRYKQQNALLEGLELLATWKPAFLKNLEWKEAFSLTEGRTDDGNFLPFIPACRLNSSIRFEKRIGRKAHKLFIEPEYVVVFRQDKPAPYETATSSYQLLNLASGITIDKPSGDLQLNLVINNLTNEAYADHLSRLKNLGLFNEGFNLAFAIRKQLTW